MARAGQKEVAAGEDEVPDGEGEGEGEVVGEESGEPAVHEDVEGDAVCNEVVGEGRVGRLESLAHVVHRRIDSSDSQGS